MCSNILVSTFFRRTLQTWRPMPWPRTSEEPTTTTKCKQTRTTTECKQTMTRKLRKLPNLSCTIFNNFKCYEDNNDIRNVCSDSKTLLVTKSCNAKGGLPQAAISRAGLSVWQWSTRLPFLVAKKKHSDKSIELWNTDTLEKWNKLVALEPTATTTTTK